MTGCLNCEWNADSEMPEWCSLTDESQSTSGTCPGSWDADEAAKLGGRYEAEWTRRVLQRREVFESEEYVL